MTKKRFFTGLTYFLGAVAILVLLYKLPVTQEFLASKQVVATPIQQVPLASAPIGDIETAMPTTQQTVFTDSGGTTSQTTAAGLPVAIAAPTMNTTSTHSTTSSTTVTTTSPVVLSPTPVTIVSAPSTSSTVTRPTTSITKTTITTTNPSTGSGQTTTPPKTTTTTTTTTTVTPPKSTLPTSGSTTTSGSTSTGGTTSTTTTTPPKTTGSTSTPTTTPPKTTGTTTTGSGSTSTGTTTTPTPPPATITNSQTGIAFGDTLLSLSTSDLNARLADAESIGITWMRIDMGWDDVQYKNSTTYDWSAFDRIIPAATAHHIKVLANLAYTPKWARPSSSVCPDQSDVCAPASNAAFATYVTAAVNRYTSKGVVDWEIWNEPNIDKFWQPAPDPAAYTALLKSAYTAIKSANPNATVISAGLAPALSQDNRIAPIEFLQDMYKDGAKPYFDAVGDHPYSFPAPPSLYEGWSGWSQMNQTPTSLRSVMIANGDSGKKIWMTEYGAPTGGPGGQAWVGDTNLTSDVDHVTEALQSQSITEAITDDNQSSWAGPIFIYSYKDLGTSSSTVENFFGLIRNDGSLKPVYSAVKKLLTGAS